MHALRTRNSRIDTLIVGQPFGGLSAFHRQPRTAQAESRSSIDPAASLSSTLDHRFSTPDLIMEPKPDPLVKPNTGPDQGPTASPYQDKTMDLANRTPKRNTTWPQPKLNASLPFDPPMAVMVAIGLGLLVVGFGVGWVCAKWLAGGEQGQSCSHCVLHTAGD